MLFLYIYYIFLILGGDSPMQINDFGIKISKNIIYFIFCDDINVIYNNEEISLQNESFSYFFLVGVEIINFSFISSHLYLLNCILVNDVTQVNELGQCPQFLYRFLNNPVLWGGEVWIKKSELGPSLNDVLIIMFSKL